MEELTYGRRMLNNKKLYDLFFCRQTNEEEENYIRISVEKDEGKR